MLMFLQFKLLRLLGMVFKWLIENYSRSHNLSVYDEFLKDYFKGLD